MRRPSDGLREMTDSEICRKYRNTDAKNKRYMIEVIAELNNCSKKDIVSILYENNELEPCSEAQYRRLGLLPQKNTVTVELPDDLIQLVTEELERLEDRVKDAKEIIKNFSEATKLLDRYNRLLGYITDGLTTSEVG